LTSAHQLAHGDDGHERRIFDDPDKHVGQRGDDDSESLGRHDPSQRHGMRHSNGSGRLVLPSLYGKDAGSEDLGKVRSRIERHANHARYDGWHGNSDDEGQPIEDPEELNKQRGSAGELNIGSCRSSNHGPVRKLAEASDDSDDRAE